MLEQDKKIIQKDIDILKSFFDVYCETIHKDREKFNIFAKGIISLFSVDGLYLCNECRRHFLYAVSKRILCPYNPKPSCKKCPAICYSDDHRGFMKKMMRFSGKYLILHGRLDLVFKYFF